MTRTALRICSPNCLDSWQQPANVLYGDFNSPYTTTHIYTTAFIVVTTAVQVYFTSSHPQSLFTSGGDTHTLNTYYWYTHNNDGEMTDHPRSSFQPASGAPHLPNHCGKEAHYQLVDIISSLTFRTEECWASCSSFSFATTTKNNINATITWIRNGAWRKYLESNACEICWTCSVRHFGKPIVLYKYLLLISRPKNICT